MGYPDNLHNGSTADCPHYLRALYTSEGKFLASITQDGHVSKVCEVGEQGSAGQGLSSPPIGLFMCVCLWVAWVNFAREWPLQTGNLFWVGILYMKRAINHLQHTRFCQGMQAVSPRRLAEFSHGKAVSTTKIVIWRLIWRPLRSPKVSITAPR